MTKEDFSPRGTFVVANNFGYRFRYRNQFGLFTLNYAKALKRLLGSLRHYTQFRLFIIDLRYFGKFKIRRASARGGSAPSRRQDCHYVFVSWAGALSTARSHKTRSATATLRFWSTLPAIEVNAPFGMRTASASVCSNESGTEQKDVHWDTITSFESPINSNSRFCHADSMVHVQQGLHE